MGHEQLGGKTLLCLGDGLFAGINWDSQPAKWQMEPFNKNLLEGLDEMFTVNAMGLPKALKRCLCTTNIIESPHSGVRGRTRRVSNWRDGKMVLRWATAAVVETQKHFKRIGGYRQLWMLKSYLDELGTDKTLAEKRKVG